MHKKAQILGQVFIYILLVIVFGLILVYGVYAVGQLMNRAEKIEIEKFKIDLRNDIANTKEFGSVEVLDLRIPGKFDELCFRSSGVVINDNEKRIIVDKIKSGAKDNMFLYPPGSESADIGEIEVDIGGPFYCFKAGDNSYVQVKLKGWGDRTRVCLVNQQDC